MKSSDDDADRRKPERLRVVNLLDPKAVTDAMASASGQRVMLNFIKRNVRWRRQLPREHRIEPGTYVLPEPGDPDDVEPPARRPARDSTVLLLTGAICFLAGLVMGVALGLAAAVTLLATP